MNSNIPILGPKVTKGSFYVVAGCSVCGSPIFRHETYGDEKTPTAHFATCAHEHEGDARFPGDDNIEVERESIRLLFKMYYQLQTALIKAMSALEQKEGSGG